MVEPIALKVEVQSHPLGPTGERPQAIRYAWGLFSIQLRTLAGAHSHFASKLEL